MESALLNVKMKHSLATFNKEEQIKQKIIEHIRSIPNYEHLKFDPECVLYVCNLVEEAYSEYIDKIKPNKKDLVTNILTLVFCMKPEEQKNVEQTIQFLHNNKKIRKVKMIKKIGGVIWDWACRRIL